MEKLEPIKMEDVYIGCATCSTVPPPWGIALMDMPICVGFGSAFATKDNRVVYDGEQDFKRGIEPKTVADIEAMAVQDPDKDWRIVMYGPLHGETYQRQAPLRWVMVESNQGFA